MNSVFFHWGVNITNKLDLILPLLRSSNQTSKHLSTEMHDSSMYMMTIHTIIHSKQILTLHQLVYRKGVTIEFSNF